MQKGLNIKKAVNKQPDVQRRKGEAPMTRGQNIDDDVAWVSEVSDSPGSYSCIQLTCVLNIHYPELSRVCSEICSSSPRQGGGEVKNVPSGTLRLFTRLCKEKQINNKKSFLFI